MSAAEKIRLFIRTHGETSFKNCEIAEKTGASVANVKMVKNRLKKTFRQRNLEERMRWAEERIRTLQVRLDGLTNQVIQ